jgi:hypothetical protein
MVVGRRVMYQWTATINQGIFFPFLCLELIQKMFSKKIKTTDNKHTDLETLDAHGTQNIKQKIIPIWFYF